MKLFSRYSRINLTFMAILFVISGLSYSLIINYVLVHELDEALDDYKVKFENYINTQQKLPVNGLMDETLVRYERTLSLHTPEVFETKELWNEEKEKLHKYRQITFIRKVSGSYYQITLAKPIEGVKMLTETVILITIITLLTVIGCSLLLNLVLLRRLWQPFYDALDALKTFRLGKKLLPNLPATDIEEFAHMNLLVKETFMHAENDYRMLKEFTENASHEMQTPLAIVRSKLDLVIQEEGLSEKQIQALQSIYSGIKRLSKLNRSLLLLAKIENHQFPEKSMVDLKEKIEEKLTQFQEFWQNNQIEWSTDIEPFTVESNSELTDILLSNLIGNAGRHNREGGSIRITLKGKELTIENTGSLQPLDSKRLFHRFYKQAQHSQHNGLGLSIVKQICDQLDITVQYSFSENLHHFKLTWNYFKNLP